jgi:class 3 adenylate cyclase
VIHRKDHQSGHLVEYSQEIASSIPNSRLVIVNGDVGIHQYDHDEVITELRRFLDDERSPTTGTTSPAIRTVLFTDLVGHTEMMRRLGG